ncbi:MAG: BspA family leucine-rich repeat surface protein [Lachnospiraceae bacterium]|nr:BspA family leucine-rich repeat surface protein [Lachnospiraceae bacterium]
MTIADRARTQYAKVFKDWHIEGGMIGRGSQGKTAVFKIIKENSGFTETGALKVINIYETFLNGVNDPTEEIEKEIDSVKKDAETELAVMNRMKGHANIVTYHEFEFQEYGDGNVKGVDLLIRMDFLENIGSRMKEGAVCSEEEIIQMGKDLSKALADCHRKGILHRDIKPDNIFRNEYGYLLGDFGIAKYSEESDLMASTMAGSFPYAAPEQMGFNGSASADSKYDYRVDIYALGLSLYELANENRIPFATSTYKKAEDIQRRLSGEPIPGLISVGKDLEAVILKACAYRPQDRYQTAEEMYKAFERLSIKRASKAAENADDTTDETFVAAGGYIEETMAVKRPPASAAENDAVRATGNASGNTAGSTSVSGADSGSVRGSYSNNVKESEAASGSFTVGTQGWPSSEADKDVSATAGGRKDKTGIKVFAAAAAVIVVVILGVTVFSLKGDRAEPAYDITSESVATSQDETNGSDAELQDDTNISVENEKSDDAEKTEAYTAEETEENTQLAGEADTKAVTESVDPKDLPIGGELVSDYISDDVVESSYSEWEKCPVFGNTDITRDMIGSVEFVSQIPEEKPKVVNKVSPSGDGSVLALFEDTGDGLYKLTIAADGKIRLPDNCADMFRGYANVKDIKFNNCVDVSQTQYMSRMFLGCVSLETIDLRGFETENVLTMDGMFFYCPRLKTIDISDFKTGNVTTMVSMFDSCFGLEEIVGLDKFDTGNVIDMTYMFRDTAVKELNVGSFDTSAVVYMIKTFSGCKNLRELDISNWKFDSLETAEDMFIGCEDMAIYIDDGQEGFMDNIWPIIYQQSDYYGVISFVSKQH